MTQSVIPRLVQEIRADVKKKVCGKMATLQSDGWTGSNYHHYIGFMILVEGKVLAFNFTLGYGRSE